MAWNETQEETRTAKPGALSKLEISDVRHCNLQSLVLQEQLILIGVAQILNDFGASADDPETDADFEIPALALWTLGKVARRAVDELIGKLDEASAMLKKVEIPAVLEQRLAKPAGEREAVRG